MPESAHFVGVPKSEENLNSRIDFVGILGYYH